MSPKSGSGFGITICINQTMHVAQKWVRFWDNHMHKSKTKARHQNPFKRDALQFDTHCGPTIGCRPLAEGSGNGTVLALVWTERPGNTRSRQTGRRDGCGIGAARYL
ncbi:MAG: hypothetical protein EOS56_20110 [Mesorhizobium sp.]|nr:MAG: hypothetical protein EOS56_20110 [Mesorhizobium sp.]RWC59851.1 MAG: hypothetical protein EOS29_21320 [Mesorhizobium sp.]